MRLEPKSKIIVNMIRYGVVLGGLAGALSMLTLILSSDTFQFLGNTLPIIFIEILSIAAFGLIYGGIFGLIAGIYGGVAMAVVTTLFYADIPSHNAYKLAMGVITTLSTALYLYSGVWHLRLDGMNISAWNIMMVLFVGLAIYASQQVASSYLYEWSIRKQKAYS